MRFILQHCSLCASLLHVISVLVGPSLCAEAVLTLRADKGQTADAAVRYHPPPSQSAAPPNSRSRALRTGKENICVPAGDDPYELFVRTERSRRDKRRPEWNTQRYKRTTHCRLATYEHYRPDPVSHEILKPHVKKRVYCLSYEEVLFSC